MIVQSDRLGPLEVPDSKIITLQKPILGFERLTRFCLIEQDDFWPFMWLQAAEDPAVSFIVVNPVLFFPDYRIEVHPKEVADLDIGSPQQTGTQRTETYVIVTVPGDPGEMSVNLQGPIVINTANNRAKQLVLVNSDYSVRHRLLDAAEAIQARTGQMQPEPVGLP